MKRYRLTWGIVLLCFGSLLLLDNLGVFSFLGVSIWKLIWPLALIALGVWVLWASRGGFDYGEEQEITVPVGSAERYAVEVRYGAGELYIDGKFGAEDLVYCKSYGSLRHEVKDSGDKTQVKLWSPAYIGPFRFMNRRKWNVVLDGSLPCDLTLTTGACDTKVDLSDTLVKSLRVDTGASSTRIILPDNAGMTEVRGSGGTASLSLIIPSDVAAHIEVKGGIYSSNINQNRFPRHGNAYESPDYESADNKVDVKLHMGVGSINIR